MTLYLHFFPSEFILMSEVGWFSRSPVLLCTRDIIFLSMVTEMLGVWFWLFHTSSLFLVVDGGWQGIPAQFFPFVFTVSLEAYDMPCITCCLNTSKTKNIWDNFVPTGMKISSISRDFHNKYSLENFFNALTFLLQVTTTEEGNLLRHRKLCSIFIFNL